MNTLKKITLGICLISIATLSAQHKKKAEFGKPSQSELALKNYPKDPLANGVVLYERGKNYVELVDNNIRLIKEVHRKIKVFDPATFNNGTVEIYYYRENNRSERIEHLQALTHNGSLKTYVLEESVFDVNLNANLSVKKFTFPNIKEGSILEYTYRIVSPYFFTFGGWEFQGNLPKIYSEFNSELPGNFKYNRALYGYETLDQSDVYIKPNCFSVSASSGMADCEVAQYAMKDVPAFKEESYMLAKKNYLARVAYELRDWTSFDGQRESFTKKWEDVDKEFRYDKDIGRQLKYANFFEEHLPSAILLIPDPLERAKAVYTFIQKHFTWNGSYSMYSEARVKEAFEEKTGTISEINLALINAMEAAQLDAKMMLLSTRENGLPTLLYPVLTDFDYIVAVVTIGGDKIILDATDKLVPFGMVPFKVLNVQGRVMDFKEGSYWHPIDPFNKNIYYINAQIAADSNGDFNGKVNEVSTGYISMNTRKRLIDQSLENYANAKHNSKTNIEISNLMLENRDDIDTSLKESYDVLVETEVVGGKTFLYPFFMPTYFTENPFTLKERKYPLDFGFPLTNTYLVSIDLAEVYEVLELPQSRVLKLPEETGEYSIAYSQVEGKINIRLNIKLSECRFTAASYDLLKTYFSNIIDIQTKEPIVLKKKAG